MDRLGELGSSCVHHRHRLVYDVYGEGDNVVIYLHGLSSTTESRMPATGSRTQPDAGGATETPLRSRQTFTLNPHLRVHWGRESLPFRAREATRRVSPCVALLVTASRCRIR